MKKIVMLLLAAVCAVVLTAPYMRVSADRAGADDDTRLSICDFSAADSEAEWTRGDNSKSVSIAAHDFSEYGLAPRECLEAVAYDLDVNLIRSVNAKFTDGLALTSYRTFSLELFPQEYEKDPYASYLARITLYSSDGTSIQDIFNVTDGEWNTVGLDIGGWDGRSDVTGCEISLIVNTTQKGFYDRGFYIDSVCADGKVDEELTARFLFDIFDLTAGDTVYSDVGYASANPAARFSPERDYLTVTLNPSDITSLKADVFIPETDWSVNSIRIKLTNYSDLENLTVYYSTYDTGAMSAALSEDKSVSVKLNKQSESRFYYLDVGDASKLRSLDLRFGSGSGTVEIESVGIVSEYREIKYTTCGSLSGCTLTDDLASVRFTGDVNRDEVLANQTGKIEIYTVAENAGVSELKLDALIDAEPLISSPMSTKFDLTFNLSDSVGGILNSRFAAVSTRADGTMTLIAPPFYLGNPERAAGVSVEPDIGKKGIIDSDISVTGEAGADVTVLTVDLGEAFASKNQSERYVSNGESYYLNGEYFSALGLQIGALRSAGVNVLLRLTGWTSGFASGLDERYLGDSYVDYSTYGTVTDGHGYLAALCSYIAGRWCADLSVSGVILGQYVNYFDSDETDAGMDSLNDLAAYAALNLRTVYNSLVSVNSGARVYISLSDMYSAELASESREIGLDEFIPALCAEISSHGSFNWGICVDQPYRLDAGAFNLVKINDCVDLVMLLRNSGVYNSGMIFCDNTYLFPNLRLSDMLARLATGYFSACFNTHIDAYIADFGSFGLSNNLVANAGVIDTVQYGDVSSLALNALQITGWKELIEGFDEDKLPLKRITYAEAGEEPSGTKGRFKYYSFDSFSGVNSFTKGYFCTELSIGDLSASSSQNPETAEDAPAEPQLQTLRAALSSRAYGTNVGGAFMGIAQLFEYPENLTLTPTLAVTLRVDDVQPSTVTEVPVKLVLTADGERFEATATVAAGEMTTLYITLDSFGAAADTKGIQLLIDASQIRSAVLQLAGIDGLSREYNDESLESVIADERERKRSPEPAVGYGALIWIGGAAVVFAATVLTVVLLSRRKDESDE